MAYVGLTKAFGGGSSVLGLSSGCCDRLMCLSDGIVKNLLQGSGGRQHFHKSTKQLKAIYRFDPVCAFARLGLR